MFYICCYKLLFMNLHKELKRQKKLAVKYSDLWCIGGTFFRDKYHYREKLYLTEAVIKHLEERIFLCKDNNRTNIDIKNNDVKQQILTKLDDYKNKLKTQSSNLKTIPSFWIYFRI